MHPSATEVEARRIVGATRAQGRLRAMAVTAGLAVATFSVICVSVSVGDFPISLGDVVPSIFGFGDDASIFIVQELRLPRAVCGLLVGSPSESPARPFSRWRTTSWPART